MNHKTNSLPVREHSTPLSTHPAKPGFSITPSSWVISVGIALILSLVYLLGQAFWHDRLAIWEALIFWALATLLIHVVLDRVVFRPLRNLQSVNQREIQKLKDMEAYRREFLGEVSHELKTPIFAIQGFIHTLIDGAMDDEKVRMKFLKKAMKNSDRLSNLVEDLLVITQAESGEMDIRVRKFKIFHLVHDVIDSLEYKFTKKQRNITCDVVARGLEQIQVYADRERIQQVLTNLVDNAIKYGDANGKVEIQLSQSDKKIFVSVKDDGPGIEEEHLDKIFRRFYRVDKSRSREKGGTGLGLAICKHLMSAHGEHIKVESVVNQGTTFTFSLKKAECKRGQRSSQRSRSEVRGQRSEVRGQRSEVRGQRSEVRKFCSKKLFPNTLFSILSFNEFDL